MDYRVEENITFLGFLWKQLFAFIQSALVWGSSVKHNPQKVGKEHTLQDEDVVQVVKRFARSFTVLFGIMFFLFLCPLLVCNAIYLNYFQNSLLW